MQAKDLYRLLDEKFIVEGLQDVWYRYMTSLEDYICDNFKQRDMGVLCDFADEINIVYTAAFPSAKVMKDILDAGVENAMLFVHHACDWDTRKPSPFSNMTPELLDRFRERKISIYCLHVPLDNYSEYSTGNSFAEALNLKVDRAFAEYRGAKNGVICETPTTSIQDLERLVEKVVGHKVVVYPHGEDKIAGSKIAIVTGGGNDVAMLQAVADNGINTYITGVTNQALTPKAHEFAKQSKINIIGATHNSTEKYACIKMVDYFERLGLQSLFVEDYPVLEDL